jgi:hypothetical protein
MASRIPLRANPQQLEPGDVFDWVRLSVPGDAAVVFLAGNGFRTVSVIAALEAELGRPVLSANQVLLWAAASVLSPGQRPSRLPDRHRCRRPETGRAVLASGHPATRTTPSAGPVSPPTSDPNSNSPPASRLVEDPSLVPATTTSSSSYATKRKNSSPKPSGPTKSSSPTGNQNGPPPLDNVIRGVNGCADLRVEAEEGHELGPGPLPQPDDGRVLVLPSGGELHEPLQGHRLGRRRVDDLEILGDRRPVPAGGVTETVLCVAGG